MRDSAMSPPAFTSPSSPSTQPHTQPPAMKRRKTSSRALVPLLLLVAASWATGVSAKASPSINDIDLGSNTDIDSSIEADASYSLTSLRHIGSAPAPIVVRADPDKCLRACQMALREPTFEDTPLDAGFRFKECYSPLMQASLFICLSGYCSDGRGGVGALEALNRTCTALRNEPLPSFEGTLADYPADKVVQLRRLQRPEAIGETHLSEVVVLSETLYENSYDTLADLEYVRKYHFSYGRSVVYFWVIVCLYGTGNHLYMNIAQMIRRRRRSGLAPTIGSRTARSTTTTGYEQVNDEEDNDDEDDLALDEIDVTGDDSFGHKQGYAHASHSITRRPRVWLQRYLSTPATFGRRCSQDFGWYTVPPRVQSVTLLIFVILNIISCIHGYHVFTDNMYWPTITQQLLRYVSDRTGIVSFANFPLIWLFGMRNNILLWLTGWDFGTYNNFHLWVARVATVQAIVHSIGYSVLVWYDGGFEGFLSWWQRFFWWTGGVATICMSLLLGLSLLWMRRNVYEVFLVVHIAFSILILFGMLFHVSIFHGEYDIYFWLCLIVWVADRAMRALRIVAFNPLFWKTRAQATYDPQSNIVRVVVPYNSSIYQPQPGTYYYLHVLNDKRFWESHPFTVATVASLNKKLGLDADADAASSIGAKKPRRTRSPPQVVELADQSDAQSVVSDMEDAVDNVDTVKTPTTPGFDTSENAGLLSGSNYGATRSHNPYHHQQRPSSSHTAATSHSIASSTPAHAASALTFLIRPYDSFTGRLRDKAAAAANPGYSSVDYSSGYAPAGPAPANLRVLVDGPYGHAQRFDDDYDSILFVVGGSGIVVPLSHLTGLGRHHTLSSATAAGRRLKNIRIVWAVREAAFAAEVLREDLDTVFGYSDDGTTGGTKVTLDIYVTQHKPIVVGPVVDDPISEIVEEIIDADGVRVSHERPSKDIEHPRLLGDGVFDAPLPPNVRVIYGRPDVRGEVEVAARRGRNRVGGADRKLAVVACGPGRMADEARKTVVDVLGRRDAGNVDYLEESFQW